MKLTYEGIQEGSSFMLTNFNCTPSQELLKAHGYYKILWNRAGSCSLKIDGYTLTLKKHQVLFCTPLNILEVPTEQDLICIVFNREFYCIRDHDHEVSCQGLLFFGSSLPPVISLNDAETQSFESMFLIFREEFETKDHIQGEMLRVLLKRLLIKSTRLVTEKSNELAMSKPNADLIRKFHILVENHFKEKHQVAEYAELLFKSPKTLSNLFKKKGESSPLKIINDRILLEAKRLLIYSDKHVDEIGYLLGYSEAAHFSKFFKTHMGLPPAQFKEHYFAKKNRLKNQTVSK